MAILVIFASRSVCFGDGAFFRFGFDGVIVWLMVVLTERYFFLQCLLGVWKIRIMLREGR